MGPSMCVAVGTTVVSIEGMSTSGSNYHSTNLTISIKCVCAPCLGQVELVEIAISTIKMALPRATTYGRNAKNSTTNLSDLSTVLMILFENLSTVSGNVKRSTMLNSKLFTKLLPTLETDTVIAQASQVPPARTLQVDMASLQGHTPDAENPTTIMGTNNDVDIPSI